MSYQIEKIVEFMDSWAKKEFMMSWDNSGRQIFFKGDVSKILLTLDIDDLSLQRAIDNDCTMIISHHPLFFAGEKNIIEGTYRGDLILKLIQNKISVYSAHTTLDVAEDGVNYALAEFLKLENTNALAVDDNLPIGLVGYFKEEKTIDEIYKEFQEKLKINNIRCYGKGNKVKKVSLCGGSAANYMKEAIENDSELFISADIKYHEGQEAYENNLLVMDLGHFHSEKLILGRIKQKLKEKFKNLEIIIKEDSSYEMVQNYLFTL